ncbi:hypothetical protein G6F31_019593 [Rhizopus arrhizus]|nr:hypothetical protein G6F31_019593 [Rhizopus arrhizus]
MTDSIHLPQRNTFHSASGYYATALHELGHWTGFPTRLNRDQKGAFGSIDYAKEELVAEVSSMLMGERLGIGHDPTQHAAYVNRGGGRAGGGGPEGARVGSRAAPEG